MFEQPVISRDHRSATSFFVRVSPFYLTLLTFLPPSRLSQTPVFYSPWIRDRRELAGIVNHGYWTVSILLPLAGIAIKGILDIRHPVMPRGEVGSFSRLIITDFVHVHFGMSHVVITDKRRTTSFCSCSCLNDHEISLKWNFAVPLKFFDEEKKEAEEDGTS